MPSAFFIITSRNADDDRVWIDPKIDAIRSASANRFWAGVSSNVASAARRFAGRLAYDAVNEWLDHLTNLYGDRLLRLKAILRVEECQISSFCMVFGVSVFARSTDAVQ